MTTEIYQKITTASHGFEFTFQTEKVPHVDDKALDELVSCVEDSSPSMNPLITLLHRRLYIHCQCQLRHLP